jgi:hypothetical protein
MNFIWPEGVSPNGKHRLDPARIIQTAENLALRVCEGLPESTLAGLAVELARVARATEERTRQASRPIYALRAASLLAIGASLSGLWYLVVHIHARWEFGTIPEVFESADAGFNLVLLLAGALWFLITLEARVKRKRALTFLGELREFIHVIDVTQLYYTPDLYKVAPAASRSSLNLDYTYLLFCTQMLAVISNLAPLYTRGSAGDSIWRAAADVEMLSNAIGIKLTSKAETVRVLSGAH